ncbi:HalD/BesD family halogenase [Streptomyces sp. 1222.5]|uniref:HalD/BesD family halogenase n=1 Tax=Streptomyces sp. 1222.5 TaxID=1881026 RepID=UPI003D73ED55
MPASASLVRSSGPAEAEAARSRFSTDGYALLPGLLTTEGLQVLRQEALRLEQDARRRDFRMASMGDSPRHMTTLGGQVIARESALVRALYGDPVLRGVVAAVTGERPVSVPDVLERHVLNILHCRGDTHGAHTDDYPYALVLFIEAHLAPADGGLLEYVPRAAALTDLDTDKARTAHHRAGDAYLLRSDTTAHRVAPLTRPQVCRTVLNFAYTSHTAIPRATPSARELYG